MYTLYPILIFMVICAICDDQVQSLDHKIHCDINNCYYPLKNIPHQSPNAIMKRNSLVDTIMMRYLRRNIHQDHLAIEITDSKDHPNLINLDKEWVIMTKSKFRFQPSEKIHHLIYKHEIPIDHHSKEKNGFIHVLQGSIANLEIFLATESTDIYLIMENRPLYIRSLKPKVNYPTCRSGSSSGVQPGFLSWGVPISFDNEIITANNKFCTTSGNDGSGVAAYVVDTGVNNPTSLNGRIYRDFDFYNTSGLDFNEHGTFIAGIIGSQVYGFATNVEIHVVKVLDGDGVGSFASLLAGLHYISLNGKVGIINLSLGVLGEYSTTIANLMINMMTNQGFIFSVAAGNDNTDAGLEFPANVPGVVTVGSYTQLRKRSDFSNRGPTVSIWAPGNNIISTKGNGTGTNKLSGTSMATAFVSGVLVLFKQLYPNYDQKDLINYLYFVSGKNQIGSLSSDNHNRRLVYKIDETFIPGMILPPDPGFFSNTGSTLLSSQQNDNQGILKILLSILSIVFILSL